MAITENAVRSLLIAGEEVAAERTRAVVDPAAAWTREVFRAQREARELEAGTVWINEHLAVGSEKPHGGVKDRGSART